MTPTPPTPPRATYRVQFGPGFGFAAAEALVPYLARLGISHLYASPYLKARPGSSHGYDITDHNAFNPEIGDAESFDRLAAALGAAGIGQILDFVPNHMGIGKSDTPWWLDVLEWGEESPYASHFDIDWYPAKPELRGKVLVPCLGDHYGKVLEAGELRLAFDAGGGRFCLWYYDTLFPITPRRYRPILAAARAHLAAQGEADAGLLIDFDLIIAGYADLGRGRRSLRQRSLMRAKAERLAARLAALHAQHPPLAAAIAAAVAALNGRPGDPASFEGLHRLLEAQAYRLAHHLCAAEEINYRRFFQINELAGIRIEHPQVFEAAHRLVFELIAAGKLHGLRIDHIDGLFDPEQYLLRLRRRVAETLAAAGRPGGDGDGFYLVVEKILAPHERLRERWPIDGTTGYDFLARINQLFVDPSGEEALGRGFRDFTGETAPFRSIAQACKMQVMDEELASELRVLANEFNKLTETNRLTRDYTLVGLCEAMREIVAAFPVYRTYVDRRGADADDRRDLEWAVVHGRRQSRRPDKSIFDFIHGVLTTDLARGRRPGFNRREVQRLAMKFQQYTGPVTAKGVEDTAFYRFHRLVSLNEVGGDPERFGMSLAAFHKHVQAQAKAWPRAMLATATHDTKRGEDCRVRIAVLSEVGDEWVARSQRWATFNARLKTAVDDEPAPSAGDEYLFYQTLIGAWPLTFAAEGELDGERMAAFRDRIVAYMLKAVREAKRKSGWIAPNNAYEEALSGFIGRALAVGQANPFLADFRAFQAPLAVAGAVNGLAQTVLKLTLPGVPDLYQGCELWDLSLVDPDNRRPVDYRRRQRLLAALTHRFAADRNVTDVERLARRWRQGWIKMFVLWRLLALRASHPALFAEGRYVALPARGAFADHVCAFARRNRTEAVVVAVPRFVSRLAANGGSDGLPLGAAVWRDTRLPLPKSLAAGTGRCVFTGEPVAPAVRGGGGHVALGALFARLPVAAVVFPLRGDGSPRLRN